jgi:hypothetical protein
MLSGDILRRILTLALLSIAILGCEDDLGPTSKFATFEHASISGLVLSDNDSPLDSVAVSFDVPPDRGAYNGGAQPPLTGKDGKFTMSVNRLAHEPGFAAPSPDTLTLRLVGTYLAVSPNDSLPHDTAYVLVTLVPKDEQAPVSSVTLHIEVPQQ